MKKEISLPLEGIRVIDITQAWAGPLCTMMLAEMGAQVIKIENASSPDIWRRIPPYADGKPGFNRGGLYANYNRGKKSCVLDLKRTEDVNIVKRLVSISDILVENFAPRVMDNLGLGYSVLKEIKPNLIIVSLSGYGASGPDRDAVAFGSVLEAYAGLSLLIGYPNSPPQRCGMYASDHTSGVLAALVSLATLLYRDSTGGGQHIDISEVETLLGCMPEAIMEYTMNGRVIEPQGNQEDLIAPCGCYRCKGEDKWVAICVETDEEWASLCKIMGEAELIDDDRFRDKYSRWKNQHELDKIISEWTSVRIHLDAMKLLQKSGIAAGPVYNSEDIYNDPHFRDRDFLVEHEHPEVGKKELPGVFAKLSESPGVTRSRDPLLGEHNDWVLNELLADVEIKKQS